MEEEEQMPRKKLEPKVETLEELIPKYGEQNTQCNALKKVVADLNARIKESIHNAKKENTDVVVSGWVCHLTVCDNSTLNEERLIEFAKKHQLDIVRTKECIDFDALESLIYKGKISDELLLEMDKCKDPATKEILRITKAKE